MLPLSSFTTLGDQVVAYQAEKQKLAATPTDSPSPSGQPSSHQEPPFAAGSWGQTCAVPRHEEPTLMSSAFLPTQQIAFHTPDWMLLSSDNVHFCVHSFMLKSKHALTDIISTTQHWHNDLLPTARLSDHSTTVNIILHAIYEIPCAQFHHSFLELANAVDRMPFYGMDPKTVIIPTHPLYELLLTQPPLHPILTYALAARHDIEALAIACSSQLLSVSLDCVTDEIAESMGAKYLKRLFFLHRRRKKELLDLLLRPFRPHPLTPNCSFGEQQEVTRAWALTSSHFILESSPDVPSRELETKYNALVPLIRCPICRQLVKDKIQEVIIQWALSRNTI